MTEGVRKREKKEVDKNIGALIAQDVMAETLDKRKTFVEKRLTESREFRLSFHCYVGIVLFVAMLFLLYISNKRAVTTKFNIESRISATDVLNKETETINARIAESQKDFDELSIQNSDTLNAISSQLSDLSVKKSALEQSSSIRPQTADDYSFIVNEYSKRIKSDSQSGLLSPGSAPSTPGIKNVSQIVTKSLIAFVFEDQIISVGMLYEPNRVLTSYRNLAPYYSFSAYRFITQSRGKDTFQIQILPITPKIIAIHPETDLAIVELNITIPMLPISVEAESKHSSNKNNFYIIDRIEKIDKNTVIRFAEIDVLMEDDSYFYNSINDGPLLGTPCFTKSFTFAGVIGKSDKFNNLTHITRPKDIKDFATLKTGAVELNFCSRYHFIDRTIQERLLPLFSNLKLVSSYTLLPEIIDIILCSNNQLMISNKNSVKLSVVDPATLKETAGIETNSEPVNVKSNGNYVFTMTDAGIVRSLGDFTNGGIFNFEQKHSPVCFEPISIKYSVFFNKNGSIHFVIFKSARSIISFPLMDLKHRIDFAQSAIFGTRMVLLCYDSKQKSFYFYNQPISDLVRVVNAHERVMDNDSQEKVVQAREIIANTKLFHNQRKLIEIASCDINIITMVKSNQHLFIGNAVYDWDKNSFIRLLDFSKKKVSPTDAESNAIIDFALSASADGRFVATSTYIYDTQTDQIVTMFPYITPKAFFTADGKNIILYNMEKNALELREIQLPQTP